ncbi:MAG: hypothetical protein GXZ15_03880 [Campylobacter sp.]|nr:hypothetical protein [Campylobacter sp.]
MIGFLTQSIKLFALFLLFLMLSSCSKSLEFKETNKPNEFKSDIMYFVGLDGFSFSLKSVDELRSAVMLDNEGNSYRLISISDSCMDGDVKICFSENFVTVNFANGEIKKAILVPIIED